MLGHRAQNAFVHFVEAVRVDLQQLQRRRRDRSGDRALRPFLGKIAG